MKLTDEIKQFIREHEKENIRELALQARRYPDWDFPFVMNQIAGRQMAREKLPSWYETEGLIYPPHLSMEQCSSEATARYKQEIVKEGGGEHGTLADLTGGFGVDCSYIAQNFRKLLYVEHQKALCELAEHNLPLLYGGETEVHHAEAEEFLPAMPPVDWLFADPARRDIQGKKTVEIADCEPDISRLEELLLTKAAHVLVKLSPMLDVTLALQQLKHIRCVHIVSVKNECKELLLQLDRTAESSAESTPIVCINLQKEGECQRFVMSRGEESQAEAKYVSELKGYLYEPNASLLKGGALKSLCRAYGVEKLHPNSHLYTSAEPVAEFPGRKFKIETVCSFNKKEIRRSLGRIEKANLTVRNFPASVAELRSRLKLREGGDTYLFATTVCGEKRVLIICRPLSDK